MKTFILLATCIIALATAQEGITLTEEQTMTINLNLCPAFDYVACLRDRIEADETMKECTSNSDCDIDSGSFCCPSKCAGMRCLPKGTPHFIEEYCPKYRPADLFKSCEKLDNQCTKDCRCCVDIESCSYKCLE